MYGSESWTIKKEKYQRIDAFKLWSWKRLLKVPWTARKSNQSILRKINPEHSLKGLMLEAETRIFWSPDDNSWLIGKVPDAQKDWGQKKRVLENKMDGWHCQFDGHELGKTLGDGEGQKALACCSPWGRKESDATGRLNKNNSKMTLPFVERRIWERGQAWKQGSWLKDIAVIQAINEGSWFQDPY